MPCRVTPPWALVAQYAVARERERDREREREINRSVSLYCIRHHVGIEPFLLMKRGILSLSNEETRPGSFSLSPAPPPSHSLSQLGVCVRWSLRLPHSTHLPRRPLYFPILLQDEEKAIGVSPGCAQDPLL